MGLSHIGSGVGLRGFLCGVCVRESVEPHADLFLTKQEVGVSSSNLAKAVRQAGERDGDTHDAYTQLVWLATEKVTSCSLYLNFFF